MAEKKIGVTSECSCDLPKSMIKEYDIGIVYFLIETDSGVFTDTDEITAENILTYMASGGKKSKSFAPSPDVYKEIFEEYLKKYDEIIHVSISSEISNSYSNASIALSQMGDMKDRVYLFDSRHLSTGLGHIVLKTAEMARNSSSVKEMIPELEKLRERVSTTFIVENTDFLNRKGFVSDGKKKLCDKFNIHPILVMKDGKITIKSITFGRYSKAVMRYIKTELRSTEKIDKKIGFITHAGCSIKRIERVKQEVENRCVFEKLLITKASATISSNCGPNTFGILFINKDI